ncbi:MAG: hypothetical protein HN641_12585 [Candidatus Marinimicrobia bacterium]|nr:hypothetical protein [Candidatus Neomarinimicrobiota bacterium]MBT7884661.1 hypothetical protein [Candidatus Neomarinimicrobiota bacterium]
MFSKNLESGGRTNEYILSMDMANEIFMVQHSAKGRGGR